jgi:hypothetical protein
MGPLLFGDSSKQSSSRETSFLVEASTTEVLYASIAMFCVTCDGILLEWVDDCASKDLALAQTFAFLDQRKAQ